MHGKEYNKRYRLCHLHLRSGEVAVRGVASRWCQTCSRFHPLAAFQGAKRTCAAQLAALRLRRRGRAATKRDATPAAAPPAAPASAVAPLPPRHARSSSTTASEATASERHASASAKDATDALQALQVPEADFLDWLDATRLGAAEGPGPQAVQAVSPVREALPPADVAWLFSDVPAISAAAAAHFALSCAVAPPDGAPLPLPLSLAIKLPLANPALIPASLAPALAAWAQEPWVIHAAAQPGCTLLTIDALLDPDAVFDKRIDVLAAVLRRCGRGGGIAALKGASFAFATDDAPRAPPPAARCVAVSGAVDDYALLQVPFASPVDPHALRCRCGGEVLPLSQAGPSAVSVALPPGFPRTALLLFDLAPAAAAADVAQQLAAPHAVVATRDPDLAAELARGLEASRPRPGGDAPDDAHTWLLGNALAAACAGDGDEELVASAAGRGIVTTGGGLKYMVPVWVSINMLRRAVRAASRLAPPKPLLMS